MNIHGIICLLILETGRASNAQSSNNLFVIISDDTKKHGHNNANTKNVTQVAMYLLDEVCHRAEGHAHFERGHPPSAGIPRRVVQPQANIVVLQTALQAFQHLMRHFRDVETSERLTTDIRKSCPI